MTRPTTWLDLARWPQHPPQSFDDPLPVLPVGMEGATPGLDVQNTVPGPLQRKGGVLLVRPQAGSQSAVAKTTKSAIDDQVDSS